MSDQPAKSPRARKVAGKFVDAVDKALDALEELKRARAALSLEAGRPPLKVAEGSEEGGARAR